ncbi:hypothetical protein E0Z10_g7453 [Xylaria hypoxylon]|uniref:Uncharacterized protein n=1 Tax=Xylaria hypoxylon TaxID=37992 RepID=A0A4Z0YBJ7_9PEZI|nr:hypothetical protein E0Z10_g7453 [Xylaria hypoxylon]
MFPVPVINKRVGVGHHPQPTLQVFRLSFIKVRRNLLLALPPELRIAIYELVVSNESPPGRFIPISKWRTPALAQVNRQLRNEVIPVYYGQEDGFNLLLSYEPGSPDNAVRRFCEHYSQYLQYVQRLEIRIHQHNSVYGFHRAVDTEFGIKFNLIFAKSRPKRDIGLRIGNDETDWNDDIAAARVFEEESGEPIVVLEHTFCSAIGRGSSPGFSADLRLLAKHTKLANQWIVLLYAARIPRFQVIPSELERYFEVRIVDPTHVSMCHSRLQVFG